MRRWKKLTLWSAAFVLAVAAGWAGWTTKSEAHRLITNPRATRKVPKETPAVRHMPFEDATVTTSDGLHLAGWFVPSDNGAVVMVLHGYKDSRGSMLRVADLIHRHGYGVLIPSFRGHDLSDGETITFGQHEMHDLDAWFAFARAHAGVDANRIGVFGASMGGALGIQFTAAEQGVRALVADCAFSSLEDTVATSVKFYTGLPPFPFAPMILFWTERETGLRVSTIDAKKWIPLISPRPVFLLQGGADVVISPDSGKWLYQAAGDPKELWYDPAIGHAKFLDAHPVEFERRVTGFFDKYLGAREHVATDARH